MVIRYSEFITEDTQTNEVVNALLQTSEVKAFLRKKNAMTQEQQIEMLTQIYNSLLPKIEERHMFFGRLLKTLSQKFKNVHVKTRIKPLQSIISKVIVRGKPLEKIPDLIGGMLITDSNHDSRKLAQDIQRKYPEYVDKVDEKKLGETGESGYHGVFHIDLKISGLLCELQVMSAKLAKQKTQAHTIYSSSRDNSGGATKSDNLLMRKFFLKGNKEVKEAVEEFDPAMYLLDVFLQLKEELDQPIPDLPEL